MSGAVVLVEDLSESRVVRLAVAESFGSSLVVTLAEVVNTHSLVDTFSVSSVTESFASTVVVLVHHLDKTKVHLSLVAVRVERSSLLEVSLSIVVVALYILSHTEVVVSAVVIRILLNGSFVDVLFLVNVVSLSGSVKELVDRELSRICFVLSCDFLVAATDSVDRSRDARVAELRKDFLSQLIEYRREVADFFLTLFRVAVHRENAEDKVFILDVALGNEFLEAVPVLSSELRSDVAVVVNFFFLEVLVQVVNSRVLTFFRQLGVEFHTTFRRSERRNVDAFNFFVVSLRSLGNSFVEVRNACAFLQLRSANVGLVDKEHKVSVADFVDYALIFVGSSRRSDSSSVSQSRSGYNAFTNFHSRESVDFLALNHVEVKVEVALHHLRSVDKVYRDCHCTAFFVVDNRIVALNLLALESVRLRSGLVVHTIRKVRSYSNLSVLFEELLRDIGSYCARNVVAHNFEWVRVGGEMLGSEVLHFLVTSSQCNSTDQYIQTDFFVHSY